jgi:hypothetical protein
VYDRGCNSLLKQSDLTTDVLCFPAFGGGENSGLRIDDGWLFFVVVFRGV